MQIVKIIKSNGKRQKFEPQKIELSVSKAMKAVNSARSRTAKQISKSIIRDLQGQIKQGEIPKTSDVRKIVEQTLFENDLLDAAEAFINYKKPC